MKEFIDQYDNKDIKKKIPKVLDFRFTKSIFPFEIVMENKDNSQNN